MAQVLKLVLAFAISLMGSNVFARDLIYLVLDSDRENSLKTTDKSTIDSFSEFIKKNRNDDFYLYVHLQGLSLHYPDNEPFDLSKIYEKESLNSTLADFYSDEIWSYAENELNIPKRETNHADELEIVAKNLLALRASKNIDSVYIVYFGNLEFNSPLKTKNKLLTDGWLTASNSPFRNLIDGSLGKELKNVNFLFFTNEEIRNIAIYRNRQQFFNKFTSSLGANLLWYSNTFKITGNDSPMSVSALKKIILNNSKQIQSKNMPSSVEFLEVIDPDTNKVERI